MTKSAVVVKKAAPKKKKPAHEKEKRAKPKKPKVKIVEAAAGTTVTIDKIVVKKGQRWEIIDSGGKLDIRQVVVEKGAQLTKPGVHTKNIKLGALTVQPGAIVIDKF